MRNRIFGAVGVFWGGGIVARWFLASEQSGNSAFQAGQNSAAIFGALLFIAGLYYLLKKPAQ